MHHTDHASPFLRKPAGSPAASGWLTGSSCDGDGDGQAEGSDGNEGTDGNDGSDGSDGGHDSHGASACANPLPSVKPAMPAWLANSLGDRLFIDMLHVFRPTGGLARESELASRWRSAGCDGTPLIRFEWSDTVWLPLFQFMPGGLMPNPVAAQVVAELSPHCDGWSLANWFAQPNTWLGGQRPVDVLKDNPARLLEAARVDRFIVDV